MNQTSPPQTTTSLYDADTVSAIFDYLGAAMALKGEEVDPLDILRIAATAFGYQAPRSEYDYDLERFVVSNRPGRITQPVGTGQAWPGPAQPA